MYALQAITFYECQNLVVKNLKIQNAQQMHVSFEKSNGVQVSNLTVTSPEGSPNTDGIHVAGTQNIQITDSDIGTGIYIHVFIAHLFSFIQFLL
jgi:polygalacturonase